LSLQGHDTVAMGLTYAILLLAENKDAQVFLVIIYLIYKHNQLIKSFLFIINNFYKKTNV